jgi:arylsulfatase A-like enzyme/Tfp pilus assembly protein PilF
MAGGSSRHRVLAAALSVALGVAAALGACRGGPGPVATFGDAPVVLVSIDTLRADHVGIYGYTKGTTPVLDALAKEAVVFDDVYSHVPLTLPAHSSLFTGLLPPHHGVRDNIGFTLKDTHATLATRFGRAGFATGGAISAYVLRSQTGISRGFDFYDDALEYDAGTESLGALQRDGGVAVDSLARWIEGQGGKRFFAFLHLYEPHSPYAPPEKHRHFEAPYDGDVAYADELVGRFLDRLKAKGLYDRVLLAVTADHGEGLMDHGEEEHGVFLYREALRVPLLLRLPGGARGGTRVRGLAAQVDIPATLLDLAGVAADGLDGVSLRAALEGRAAAARTVYSETLYARYHFGWSELFAATDARFRYIRAPRPELYDVAKDPGEKENLAAARASTATAMNEWIGRTAGASAITAPEEVEAETREKLAALGYVGSGSASLATAGDLPDPKDKIATYEDYKRALQLRQQGKNAEAVEQFRKVLAQNPRMLDAWELLGMTLVRIDREADGIAAFKKVLEMDPLRADTNMALAKLYALRGKLDLATQHAEIASGKEPGKGYEILAEIMMDKNQLAQAATFARKSVAADDQRMMSHYVLGVVAQRAGRYEEALASFRKAEAAKSRQRHSVIRALHANMGDCLARLGRDAEAEKEFQAEIAAIPRSREGRIGLAMLYRSQGRDAEARAVLAGLVEGDPMASADAYYTVVRTFTVLGDMPAAREFAARARQRFPADPRFR